MKHFIDGDHLAITKDDFENLQESPAVFIGLQSEISKIIQSQGFRYLCIGDLRYLQNLLAAAAQPEHTYKSESCNQTQKVV